MPDNRKSSWWLILAVPAFVAIADKGASAEPLAEIAVTRSWADLLQQDTMDLGDQGLVRLGIESRQCAVGSGLLLYVLTDGYRVPDKYTGSDRVGPVFVAVRQRGQPRLAEQSAHLSSAADRARGKLLFVRPILMCEAQPVEVTIRSAAGDELAHATIRSTDETFHAWLPFERGHRPADDDERISRVVNREKGRALPNWDSMKPIVFEGSGYGRQIKLARHDALPTLLPKEVDEIWSVSTCVDRHGVRRLIIESKQKFVIVRADWHFLTRWWVNDTPFIPAPLTQVEMENNGLMSNGNRLELALDFDPKRIGAKAGDRVTLQMMYVQDGWQWVTPQQLLQLAHPGHAKPPALLNRVEWVVEETTAEERK